MVSSAARGLVGLFRELAPGLLEKRDRGRGADLQRTVQQYGHKEAATRVLGADLLEAALLEEGSEGESEGDSEGDVEVDAEVDAEAEVGSGDELLGSGDDGVEVDSDAEVDDEDEAVVGGEEEAEVGRAEEGGEGSEDSEDAGSDGAEGGGDGDASGDDGAEQPEPTTSARAAAPSRKRVLQAQPDRCAPVTHTQSQKLALYAHRNWHFTMNSTGTLRTRISSACRRCASAWQLQRSQAGPRGPSCLSTPAF